MSNVMMDCGYIRDAQRDAGLPTVGCEKNIFYFFFSEKEKYLLWLEGHGRQPETIKTYSDQLDSIRGYVVAVMGSKCFNEIDEDDIFMLLASLTGVCETTRKLYIETFGRFVEFVTGINVVKKCKLLWNKCDATSRRFIRREDWPKIQASARSTSDKLILYLGAYMGLRRAEIARIRLGDIDGDYLIIRGKGHGDGSIVRKYIPKPVQDAIREYMVDRRSVAPSNDTLLVILSGVYRGRAMTAKSVCGAVREMKRRTGIDFTPHSLRRLYATSMWEATGKDVAKTKSATRHISTDVLMNRYINVDPESERDSVDNLLKII